MLAKETKTGKEIVVPAGKYTTVSEGQPPTEPDDIGNLQKTERAGEQETAEDEDEDKGIKDIASIREELRREIREAILDIKFDMETAREVIEDTKESDSSTGRTLRDIHGNLVRVEQYFMRPEPGTVHFISITKRDNYKYNGRMNVADTGVRIDCLETKMSFNLEMPNKISDWIGFFKDISDNDKDFYITDLEMKMTNQKDSIVIAANNMTAEDELGDFSIEINNGSETWNLLLEPDEYEEGDLRSDFMEKHEGSGNITWLSDDGSSSWSISQKLLLFKDINNNNEWDASEVADTKWVRSGFEFWGINNDGELMSEDVFTDLTMDGFNPKSLVENIACEFSGVLRYSNEIISDPGYILNQEGFDAESAAVQGAALKGFNRAENLFSGNKWNTELSAEFLGKPGG